jgi:putative DNA-invertase from lambdoid prophage Rac
MITKCAIWARVSGSDQLTENQLTVLRAWAARRGLEVAAEFVTEDSAWATTGGNGKGAEFDKARAGLLNGARLGHYQVVLIWALDRLSRRGQEDTLTTLRQLAEYDTDVWSHEESWLQTGSPEVRSLLVGIFAWLAEQESKRRSARIKAGMATRRAKGEPMGGAASKRGKDAKPRSADGYRQAWAEGGARRTATRTPADSGSSSS